MHRKKQGFCAGISGADPVYRHDQCLRATIEKDGVRLYNNEMTPEVAKLSVEVLRKYGLIPVMEGADFMYYDKDEYTLEINWYRDLITEALGPKWRPIRGYEDSMHINKISAKMTEGCNDRQACLELSQYYDVIRHENNAFVGTTIELVPKGCNKAVGIAAVCRIFDIPWGKYSSIWGQQQRSVHV